MDRARDFTSNGELMYKEVITCLMKAKKILTVKNCTYGICGADLLPSEITAIFKSFSLNLPDTLRVGVKGKGDEYLVPHVDPELNIKLSSKFKELIVYALGSDGTIGAIRNAMKIL